MPPVMRGGFARRSAAMWFRVAAAAALLLAAAAAGSDVLAGDAYEGVYVVQLRSYRPLAVHEAALRGALQPAEFEGESWAFVTRHNLAAATLPTDFVLVRAGARAARVLAALRAAADVVRSVTPQAEHGRALRAFMPRRQTQDSEEADGAGGELGVEVAPRLQAFGAGALWDQGAFGQGVRVAVFDTGIVPTLRHFDNVVERTDWTDDRTTDDRVGHGTFVAGLIGGSHPRCPGIAPGVELLTFRVFAGAQVSYTSWFLDAFNYALQVGVDVLNLSIGGPDFADEPFTDKINELTSAGVIVVSAIGNDGPLWGSLNNPADMMEVVGVGGIEPDGSIAPFSSRGMTTHELSSPHASYGRVKPDIVAYGRAVSGPSHKNTASCRRLSGTSVASPVVAGAIALIASTVPLSRRKAVVNPASMKRALLQSSRLLTGLSAFEQGSGLLDIAGAARVMKVIDTEYLASVEAQEAQVKDLVARGQHDVSISGLTTVVGPQAVLFPSSLDLTSSGCPLMWPHCSQPLFAGGAMLTLNITILNPGGVSGALDYFEWIPARGGAQLSVHVSEPARFWPWAAGLGVHLSIADVHAPAAGTEETAEGVLRLRIRSVHQNTYSEVDLPIRVGIAALPPREKRLLWDMYHSLRYPPGYVPRDSLSEPKEMLDWLGDHPHTNYHSFYRRLRLEGYYVDVLDTPISCLPDVIAKSYGALLLVDTEDYFAPEEISKVESLVREKGMGLVVASEWYNLGVMHSIRFEDDNTRSWWMPVSAGGNVPAVNDLLRPHGVALGNLVVDGTVRVRGSVFRFESGNGLVQLPPGSEAVYARKMMVNADNDGCSPGDSHSASSKCPEAAELPVLGVTLSGAGAVAVYGDTNCIDTAYRGDSCHQIFVDIIKHVCERSHFVGTAPKIFSESVLLPQGLSPDASVAGRIASPLQSYFIELLRSHSRTLSSKAVAGQEGGLEFRDMSTVCAARFARMLPAINEKRKEASVVFPSLRYADPVQTRSAYYSPHITHSRLPFLGMLLNLFQQPRSFTQSDIESFPLLYHQDSTAVLKRRPSSAIASILLGLTLILISIMFKCCSSCRQTKRGRRRQGADESKDLSSRYFGRGSRASDATTSSISSLPSTATSAASLKYLGRWR